jgi:hypothetical protein
MSRKIQLMVLPDASGIGKCQGSARDTLVNLPISASSACGCKLSKRFVIHEDETPKLFQEFTKDNETQWIQESNPSIK